MDFANKTNFVVPDCAIAFPESLSTLTCEDCTLNPEQLICSVPAHHVNRSPSKENAKEALTTETASEQSYKLLEEANPNSFVLKTCLDCYQPPLFPEPTGAHISNRCSRNFTHVGTMRNGVLSEQPNLKLSGEERASYSLPRPGALSKSSASSRPPGNTKSEAQAKKLGIIQKNEVFNPEWLEQEFGLPIGWTDPQECRAATELIALVEPPSEISSTPDSLRSHSEESSISIPYVAESDGEYSTSREEKDSNGDKQNSPSNLISPSKKRLWGEGNGYIHWRTLNKNGKDYRQAFYHWKENGKKRTKYIPKQLLGLVEEAEKLKRPVIDILELLGVRTSSQKLLGDKKLNEAESIETSRLVDSPSNSPSNYISPSKMRRDKGEGSGTIHWRTITKNGKDYPQAYYHYEFWSGGDRLTKSSRYIPKRLLQQIQKLDIQKVPVQEILQVLGVLL